MSHAENFRRRRKKTHPDAAKEISNLVAISTALRGKLLSPSRGNTEFEFQQDCRAGLLNELTRRADILASKPRVFISYSGAYEPLCRQAKEHFEKDKDFEGAEWRDHDRRDEDILIDIRKRIASCTCFLGIWTGYYDSTRCDYSDKTTGFVTPSVFMPYELGLARANRAVYRVLIPHNLHRDFVIDKGRYIHRFDAQNFGVELEKATAYFKEQIANRPARWAIDSPVDGDYRPR